MRGRVLLLVALVGTGAGSVAGAAYAQAAGSRAGHAIVPAGGQPTPPHEQVLSVRYRGAWGTGLLTGFTVSAGGRFVWRHREPNVGGPARPMHTRIGALPDGATADLVRRIEALVAPPYRLIDSPVVEFRWRGADGGRGDRTCYAVPHSPCSGVLDAVDALAQRYGAPTQ